MQKNRMMLLFLLSLFLASCSRSANWDKDRLDEKKCLSQIGENWCNSKSMTFNYAGIDEDSNLYAYVSYYESYQLKFYCSNSNRQLQEFVYTLSELKSCLKED